MPPVGYVVGLGDRHVQNILIDCNTAELVHIDLGKIACFNMCMSLSLYPFGTHCTTVDSEFIKSLLEKKLNRNKLLYVRVRRTNTRQSENNRKE